MAVHTDSSRPPITPDLVVSTAVGLTRSVGLYGWSVRDLAAELGTSTSAVYHHVGGRDELCRRVAERCISEVRLPLTDLPWDDWFREFFRFVPEVLGEFPGLAKWMIMHGPLFADALPILDAAITKLREAGFGEHTALVYSTIFNTLSATMMASDERLTPGDDAPRDHRTMYAQGSELADQSPGLHEILGYMRHFTGTDHDKAAATSHYLDFLLDTLLHGLSRLLPDHDAEALRIAQPAARVRSSQNVR